MNTLRCFLNDLRVQRRSGFWAVYGILCAAYLAGLFFAPEKAVSGILAVILFADPCALGFYFVGGFAYLERDDGTFAALMTTPVDYREHLAARVLSFTALALVASFAVVLPPLAMGRLAGIRPVFLFLGVGFGAAFFTLVGLLPASRFATVNDYIVAAEFWLIPFLPPFLARFGFLPDVPIWRFFPSDAVLALLDEGLRRAPPNGRGSTNIAFAVFVLVLWTSAAWVVAARSFRIRMIERGGGV